MEQSDKLLNTASKHVVTPAVADPQPAQPVGGNDIEKTKDKVMIDIVPHLHHF